MSLWERTQTKKEFSSPHYFFYPLSQFFRETSLFTCQKASYTVEAVLILPLMAIFFTMLLFFFRILQVQYTVEEALLYAGRKTAIESSITDSKEVLLASAKGYFLYALGENEIIETYVTGGIWGIMLWESEFLEEQICLRATYQMSLPIDIWDIGKIRLYSQNLFQKWKGDKGSMDTENETYVYITPNGTVYHTTPSCRILDIRIQSVNLSQIEEERGKNGQKYYSCSRCKDMSGENDVVYCTDYGTLYHMDISCSALKRTVNKVKREEIENRNPCSFCGLKTDELKQ